MDEAEERVVDKGEVGSLCSRVVGIVPTVCQLIEMNQR